ncbi:MAG TPA: hypothetical protein VMP68_19725 [Candidatus Eisenbacteria bacterium]|nr:hypothetical protein [Candidatus Eisenbacteria bacterium]
MQILKIVIQGVGETIMLRFNSKELAEKYREKIQDACNPKDGVYPGNVYVEDDFGFSVYVPPYGVLLMMMIDFEKAMEGDAVWQYNQKKIQERTINRLMAESPIIHKAFQ